MAKVLCVLYDDPVDGDPQTYARDGLPKIDRYPGGQTIMTAIACRSPSRKSSMSLGIRAWKTW